MLIPALPDSSVCVSGIRFSGTRVSGIKLMNQSRVDGVRHRFPGRELRTVAQLTVIIRIARVHNIRPYSRKRLVRPTGLRLPLYCAGLCGSIVRALWEHCGSRSPISEHVAQTLRIILSTKTCRQVRSQWQRFCRTKRIFYSIRQSPAQRSSNSIAFKLHGKKQ